jgi:hypothetical protein
MEQLQSSARLLVIRCLILTVMSTDAWHNPLPLHMKTGENQRRHNSFLLFSPQFTPF